MLDEPGVLFRPGTVARVLARSLVSGRTAPPVRRTTRPSHDRGALAVRQ
jgi:hypothetical protein